jgi:hypothetical protein
MAAVCIMVIPIALLHFFTGSSYSGPYPLFVNGYLLDILLPFALYFLLSLQKLPLLSSWLVKGVLVLGAAFLVEIAQSFGVPVFGRTYDPLDFVMYAAGVMLAILLDTTLFPRVFAFWKPRASGST